MVSALDSGSSGPGSSPCRVHCVVFLGRTLYSHSASLTQVYKWVPAKMPGVSLRWSSNTPSCFMLMKLELSAGPIGHLACRKAYLPRLLSVSCLYTYTDVSFWLFLFQSSGIGRKVKKK